MKFADAFAPELERVAPTALSILFPPFPAFPGWAKFCRAHGASEKAIRGAGCRAVTHGKCLPQRQSCCAQMACPHHQLGKSSHALFPTPSKSCGTPQFSRPAQIRPGCIASIAPPRSEKVRLQRVSGPRRVTPTSPANSYLDAILAAQATAPTSQQSPRRGGREA